MLELKNISKQYRTGELLQNALQGISISFRDSEFVSVLGPSGSGKTTLLNIIGGLDRCDSGELVINGISTKAYKDREWDAYRNHTIGFVFQSYNLIPHQSILANVELALTIGGISGSERRKRAKKALEEVGLGDQLHKKPNQMSGGQMQRVAIARALVNNPAVLLADEPTGALDTETSIQVMDLLKEVAKDRLVVMVTHNPELAEQYSTRIVKLRDGKIADDSDPYDVEETAPAEVKMKHKAGMNFLTSLSLSFHNLKTKKGRTFLTAFAGSIGIIGIALILALSTGVNNYISSIQKDTMSSYPITLSAETIDMTNIMGMRGQMMGGQISRGRDGAQDEETEKTGVYVDPGSVSDSVSLAASITENDLTSFKRYLDDPESEIHQYLGENGIVYTYDTSFEVFAYDAEDNIINTDADTDEPSPSQSGFSGMMAGQMSMMGGMGGLASGSTASENAENFSEMMVGSDGTGVSRVITDSYDILSGRWPEAFDEVVLVLGEENQLSAEVMYQLGFLTADEYQELVDAVSGGGDIPEIAFGYEEVLNHQFYLVPACDHYAENEDGTFTYIGDDPLYYERLLENSVELKITGIIKPKADAANAGISTSVGYTQSLTEYLIRHTNESAVVRAQEASPEINILTGMRFDAADDTEKTEDAITYIETLGVSDKALLYQMIQYYSLNEGAEDTNASDNVMNPDTENPGAIPEQGQGGSLDESTMAQALDRWLSETPDTEILLSIYEEYVAGASYEDNMQAFGKVSQDAPSSISLYTDSFEDKEAVADCIARYNETVDDDTQITYTDYVELMTSSLTSIINVISYVLIAFVAVSLVVSCIMIGIITHISVLERTKEIGILRALGASKRNISQVFNAETVIVGSLAGLLGVGISALLTIPANAVLGGVLGATDLSVSLPITSAVLLVVLSMVITVIGGLLPAKSAAKKDPVVALRTE